MILKFKQQLYQHEATMALVKCFSGQTKGARKELVGRKIIEDPLFGKEITDLNIFSNNPIHLTDIEFLKNIQEVQKEQGLKVVTNIEGKYTTSPLQGFNITIEMETGTGKTYVYTKTMFELNKVYGWSKFIIMVPSIAIREGVNKSLEITADHFQEIYGKKIRFTIYNTQKKSNLVNIKSFANTSNIEVIIMNYQAFATKSKESRKIFQELDSLQSEKPIDIIKRTRPIIIMDEPQRFGEKAEALLHEFDPLFNIRYSATHKKEYNKIYRLDAIDAYNKKLVKKINVIGIESTGNSGTNSYLFLDRILISTNKYPVAFMEIEVNQQTGLKKVIRKIAEGDNLFEMSGELIQYRGFVVKEINGLKNSVSFTNGVEIFVGQVLGDVDEEHIRRIQIRETIKSHLEKEQKLFNKGIKVLSLFFIDEVAKYRQYDKSSNEIKSEYALIFEEEYRQLLNNLNFLDENYYNYITNHKTEDIHKGYFSIDKNGRMVNSVEKRTEEGSDDESAYDLIMKNKEKLLSLSEPTRFIFSHSALREGWDNPNVFQICTLKYSQSTISKRQEIGRGLRICVNNKGERMDYSVLENEFFDINTLSIIASESYDEFAKGLQNEIVETLSDRPIQLKPEILNGRVLKNSTGNIFTFDTVASMDLIVCCKNAGYLDDDYKITENFINAVEKKEFQLSPKFNEFKGEIIELLQSIYSTANFKAADNEKANNIKEEILKPNDNFAKKEFQELWKKIKVKTVYEVDFDSEELINKCITSIDEKLEVKKIIVTISEGKQTDEISKQSLLDGTGMVRTRNISEKTDSILGSVKYDLIGEITKETKLTRKTVVEILKGINETKFKMFRTNPESFIKEISKLINEEKATTLINNIIYSKTDKEYEDDIFTINNFNGTLSKNILEVKKHIYDYIKTDSENERTFANALESGEILVYAKLPGGFKIPTPVGNYNPDWAIVFDTDKFKYVYFIAETKGSMSSLQLRGKESLLIDYAKKHFEALGNTDVKYDVITSYQELINKVMV